MLKNLAPRRNFLMAAVMAAAGTVWSGSVLAQSKAAQDLDALVKAAKAEGEVTFYSTQTEIVCRRVAEAFKVKYGINTLYIRLASSQVQQRYSAEAVSGNIAADVVFNAGNSVQFAQDAIKNGWVQAISEANLPTITGGDYPRRFLYGPTAVIQIAPENIVYNTEKVKGADIPKDWPDLLKPIFKNQIIVADPKASDATLGQWVKLKDVYGEDFLKKLNEQINRRTDSGVPAIQALGAGEGMIMVPISWPPIQILIDKGAPVNGVAPDLNVGIEIQAMLTVAAKAKHPNAGRLLANYVLSPEGNKVFNDDPGDISVYDTSHLPKKYDVPHPTDVNFREQIRNDLGFK